jgi:hypothetical protein
MFHTCLSIYLTSLWLCVFLVGRDGWMDEWMEGGPIVTLVFSFTYIHDGYPFCMTGLFS